MSTRATQIVTVLEKKYHLDIEGLIECVLNYNPKFNAEKFREAFRFAALAHDGQLRKQESLPYILHPFETAKILTQIHADETTLIASLLHDVPEDTNFTLEHIEHKFGKQVAYMVEGITKLSKVHYRNNMETREIESMKKLFIHVAEDPRTMLIKLADRLHNMRTLEYMDKPEKRLRKARETLEIFTPIASLLGIKEIQSELEDLCFVNLYPEDFGKLKKLVLKEQQEKSKELSHMIHEVEKSLKSRHIDAIVYAYQENLYQIYKRLKQENKTIAEHEITLHINIIVPELSECYETLGVVHSLYRPIPGRFKDYISIPKASGYQSLHSTVFGKNGVSVKFRIRTNQMHFEAQYGIAASYFSEDPTKRKTFTTKDPRSQWVEEVIAIQKDEKEQSRYFDDLKTYVFQDRINVLTPKGATIDLPSNATCIDFAYFIHTEVGNRAVRAIVNGNNVSLDYRLHTGDVVKIVTTDYTKSPSYEWLNIAKTTLARKKMREFFKRESHSSKITVGRKMLQKEYDRAGLGIVSNFAKWRIAKLAEHFPDLEIKSTEDIWVHLAEGSISPLELINLINPSLNYADLKNYPTASDILTNKSKRFHLSIVCRPDTDLTKLADVAQKRRDRLFIISNKTKYSFLAKKITVETTMYTNSYTEISQVCRELESIEGVEQVHRLFWSKKFVFILGSLFTFGVWAIHPFLLYSIANEWQGSVSEIRLSANIALYAGLFLLCAMIYLLKQYTEKSFPEYREQSKLWTVTYLLNFFALITIFLEVYIYQLTVDWGFGLVAMGLILGYLISHFFYSRKERLQKSK